jgi:hypothetical protein
MVIGCLAPDPRVQTPAAQALGFGVDRVFVQYEMWDTFNDVSQVGNPLIRHETLRPVIERA